VISARPATQYRPRSYPHTTSKLAIIIMSSCSRLWQSAMSWVGHKLHLTKSCDDEDLPNLTTSVRTTVATVTDVKQLRAILERLSRSRLLPAERLADAAYVCASNLVSSHARQIDLAGPPTRTTPGKRRPKKALTWPVSGYSGLESGGHHAPVREYFGLHVRGSPEPNGTSSERGTTVSSAILLRWSRVPDPPDGFES
jgi:hypothetical protein